MTYSALSVTNFRSIEDSGRLELGPVTVIVGANNAGKSSLLRALLMIQSGAGFSGRDVRSGQEAATCAVEVAAPLPQITVPLYETPEHASLLTITAQASRSGGVTVHLTYDELAPRTVTIANTRPNHLVVPILGNRKAQGFAGSTERTHADAISLNDSLLASRLDALRGRHAEGQRYRSITQRVLGIEIETHLGDRGSIPGIPISTSDGIDLERMGDGVRNVVSAASELADTNTPRLFLVEEPENDLHPHALERLLEVIIESTSTHQFIVTTHSDTVLLALGSMEGAKVYECTATGDLPPTSRYRLVEGSLDRWEVLDRLGYRADLPLGWLVFEEASAEIFVRDALIPIFTPRLGVLRTVSSGGAGNVPDRVRAVTNLSLFCHLADGSRPRAWVLVDGDSAGDKAIQKLTTSFAWPTSHWKQFSAVAIEDYYPDRFAEEVSAIQTEANRRQRGELKVALARRVGAWAVANPDEAKPQLSASAAEVVMHLEAIQVELLAELADAEDIGFGD